MKERLGCIPKGVQLFHYNRLRKEYGYEYGKIKF